LVTTRFLLIAAVMVVVALACVLVPMLRTARREGRPRAPFVLALVLALLTPPLVLGMYLAIGTPQALHALPSTGPAALAKAAEQLRASLDQKPDDAQGWALLSQAYSALNQPAQAMAALDRLLKLKPDDPDALVAWVEAAAETSPTHAIDAAARAKLRHALRIQPTHQRALWLLGISDFQRARYADAARHWQALLPLLQPGSKVALTVQQELAEAQARAAGSQAGATRANSTTSGNPASAAAVALKVTVKLDPKFADRVKPDDTLFVFARAVGGPPMPLAVARLKASALPASVTLTDAMAMTPRFRLSEYPDVQVTARISKSGDAMSQPGDLESRPVRVATNRRSPVALTIDRLD
jgi:cytochrome c-type biogenesis protein CcmH